MSPLFSLQGQLPCGVGEGKGDRAGQAAAGERGQAAVTEDRGEGAGSQGLGHPVFTVSML